MPRPPADRRSPALLALLGALGCSDYNFHKDQQANGGEPPDDTAPPADTAPPPGDTADPPSCPEAARADGPGLIDEACIAEPTVGRFEPVIEWQWAHNAAFPGYHQNMSTPAVGRLRDTNGDGVVGEGDLPDVVFTSYIGSAYSSPGALTVTAGDGSGDRWSVMAPGGEPLYGAGGVAIGDLDNDGQIEVCVAGVAHAVVCLSGLDGSLRWAAGAETAAYGAPAIADLDGDGLAEVIFGRQVFEHDGALRFVGAGGRAAGSFSFAADWDGDGRLDVIAGSSVYDATGAEIWTDGQADGMPAVADLDGDGRPELIRSSGGTIRASAQDGTVLWATPVPGGGSGGPPVVADLDGDGEVEVGVAGLSYFTVYETDGSVKWSRATEDDSSSVTGAAVFDFEGDGDAEIVYSDEHNLMVYAGATGELLLLHEGHASGTLYEYPIIADVDGDGATEIIVASNNMWWEGWTGITVLGDATSSWAPARPIWNQHAYSITHIDDDSGVPAVVTPNWLSWNNFRAGGTVLGPSHWRPNLRLGPPELCTDTCGEGLVSLWVPVENNGLVPTSAEPTLELRPGSPGSAPSRSLGLGTIPAGVVRWAGPLVVDEAEWGAGELYLRLDGLDAIDECDERDNVATASTWPCP